MVRMPPIPLGDMSSAQREVYDRIVSGPRGHIGGPHWSWLRSPPLAEAAQSFGRFCRFETGVGRRMIEVAILVTAVHWRARLEWDLHVPVATGLGIPAEAIEAIRLGRDPVLADPAERAVHDFCHQLLAERRVAPDVYRELVRRIGEPAAAELVGILGYYALVSMTIVAFEVPTSDSGADPFPSSDARAD
jgi:4-carboxymuconolactone decarboxylase